MAASPTAPATVLVVADVHDELPPLVDALKAASVAAFDVTTDERHALTVLARGGAWVVALAHSRLELSLSFYVQVLKRLPAEAISVQAILLCNRIEAARAYELCRDAVLDDYLVTRPLYDAGQLPLAIKHARDRLTVRRWMVDVTTLPERRSVAGCVTDLEAAVAAHAPDNGRLERALSAVRDAVAELSGQLAQGAHLVQESRTGRDPAGALTAASTTPAPSPAPARHETAVLVVDDDEFTRNVTARFLESGGYRVVTATDGASAIDTLLSGGIRVVLMDVEMPGLSGIETTRRIRERWSADELPIIMLTGHGEQQVVVEAVDAGISDFVVKPASQSKLLAKVAQSLLVPTGTRFHSTW
jgi:CheY-like chemotaxis protein